MGQGALNNQCHLWVTRLVDYKASTLMDCDYTLFQDRAGGRWSHEPYLTRAEPTGPFLQRFLDAISQR